jgi:hypothetical protein
LATAGRVRLSDIFEMLKKCAPGHTFLETDHHFRISYKGEVFPSLPNGEHGKRSMRAEIQKGVVKKMVRVLGIRDCAAQELPILLQ